MTTTKMAEIEQLKFNIQQFADDRDWQKYHSPKNLAMALIVETAELVEIFQWMTISESQNVDTKTLTHIKEEIGDIMIYLTAIADKFDLDPIDAAFDKMQKNATKYPADNT